MSSLTEILLYAVNYLTGFYVAVCALRFLLQLTGADYYNPVSQAIVKATKYPVLLLRKVIPSHKNIDFASLVWTVLTCFLFIEIIALLFLRNFVDPSMAIIWTLLGIANLVLNIYFYGFIVVIILSWVSPRTIHPAIQLILQLVEPAVRPFRQILPTFGGLDFSPILVFLVISFLKRSVVLQTAIAMGLKPMLVPGF